MLDKRFEAFLSGFMIALICVIIYMIASITVCS